MFKETLYRNLGGTNINNINFEMIKNIKIPLPPLEKQREIANNIAAIRAEAKRLEQEGEEILQSARLQVEQIILGEKDIEG
jgi:restriction endonuclease S subunit